MVNTKDAKIFPKGFKKRFILIPPKSYFVISTAIQVNSIVVKILEQPNDTLKMEDKIYITMKKISNTIHCILCRLRFERDNG